MLADKLCGKIRDTSPQYKMSPPVRRIHIRAQSKQSTAAAAASTLFVKMYILWCYGAWGWGVGVGDVEESGG